MSVRSFFDTNVLVYTDDHDAPEKQARALELVERARLDGWGVLSTQVLQEYFVAATRKLGVPAEIARRKVELFARLDLVICGLHDILGAIDIQRLHRIGFWDALIVRAARESRCAVLYTEDLQPGQHFDGLEVVNPFSAPG
ncbi:MAG: PIN domain-containing protein [Gemmatimonadota bacterium]|nr:MAG: PIN domain-containing protein [Gemmatimonadota bacterium]